MAVDCVVVECFSYWTSFLQSYSDSSRISSSYFTTIKNGEINSYEMLYISFAEKKRIVGNKNEEKYQK